MQACQRGDMSIQQAQSDEQIALCFPVLHKLRPQLTEADFLPRIRRQNETGYKLVYASTRASQSLSPDIASSRISPGGAFCTSMIW